MLSDEQIEALLEVGNPTDEEKRLIRLGFDAAQSVQAQAGAVPLTQTQVVEAFCKHPHPAQFVTAFDQGVRFAETHHGIKGKTK